MLKKFSRFQWPNFEPKKRGVLLIFELVGFSTNPLATCTWIFHWHQFGHFCSTIKKNSHAKVARGLVDSLNSFWATSADWNQDIFLILAKYSMIDWKVFFSKICRFSDPLLEFLFFLVLNRQHKWHFVCRRHSWLEHYFLGDQLLQGKLLSGLLLQQTHISLAQFHCQKWVLVARSLPK